MTKKEILDYIDRLIADEKESTDAYNKGIAKMSDSPRIVDLFGRIYQEETRHIADLQSLRQAVETHEETMQDIQLNKLFNTMDCCNNVRGCYADDGIVFTTDEKKGDKE